MTEMTIQTALLSLGFDSGWVVSEHGIILWENEQPQPTEAELIAAGWVKAEVEATDETPTAD
jgi:hypothetical protein